MNRQPRTLRVCFLAALAIGLTPVAGPGQASAQNTPQRNALVEVSLMSSDDHVVVSLVGSQALSGEVHEIGAAPFRIFVDFVNVVPKVDAVTPVNHGGVRQVRVALNQTDPPVTRVVLDLTHRSSYRVEEDPDDYEFRVLVGPAGSLTTTRSDTLVTRPAPASLGVPSTVLEEYADWFARLTKDVERLLSPNSEPKAEGTPPEVVGLEWQRLQYELEMVTPPVSLRTAHDLVETAIGLGRVGATTRLDDSTQARHGAAARAGAALLVTRARRLVEAELAARSDGDQ